MNVTRLFRLSSVYRNLSYISRDKCFKYGFYGNCLSFSTESESFGQSKIQEEEDLDPDEYYDEYTDTEEFEDDEEVEWEYDDQGIGHNIETGQPIISFKDELKLPPGILFFLRSFGVIAFSGMLFYVTWYAGTLTLFGHRYNKGSHQSITEVIMGRRNEPNIVVDYIRNTDSRDTTNAVIIDEIDDVKDKPKLSKDTREEFESWIQKI